MTENTEPNNTYFCPVCGSPMTFQGMQPNYMRGHEGESYPVLACKDDPVCPVNQATVSLDAMQTDTFYNNWKVKRVYSPLTGERILDNG